MTMMIINIDKPGSSSSPFVVLCWNRTKKKIKILLTAIDIAIGCSSLMSNIWKTKTKLTINEYAHHHPGFQQNNNARRNIHTHTCIYCRRKRDLSWWWWWWHCMSISSSSDICFPYFTLEFTVGCMVWKMKKKILTISPDSGQIIKTIALKKKSKRMLSP